MQGTRIWPVLLLLLASLPAVGQAQSFRGTGQQATELFSLPEGLAVFELTHQGESQFVVQLLDADGKRVGELARAVGPFDGSKALRIDRGGRYLLDVTANGAWTVTLRDGAAPAATTTASTTTASAPSATPVAAAAAGNAATGAPAAAALLAGREAGVTAAGRLSGAWVLRGLVGGTLAGPVGLGFAVHRAGGSTIAPPTPPSPPSADALFTQGFREGFESRTRLNRRKSAFVGGMMGTAILTTALIYFIDPSGSGSGTKGTDGGNPQLGIVR